MMSYSNFLKVWFEDKTAALDILSNANTHEFVEFIGINNNIPFLNGIPVERRVKGCGENLFHHIAREGTVVGCCKILDIANRKEFDLSPLLLQCDISGYTPLTLSIINSYYEIADMMLDHIPAINRYHIDPKKKSFNKKIIVSEQHPLRIALDLHDYTSDVSSLYHIISKIIPKMEKQTLELGDMMRRVILTKNHDLFRLAFMNFATDVNYRLTMSWIVEENSVEMLQTFFDILREKRPYPQSQKVSILLTEFDFDDMILSMHSKLDLFSVFLDNYDFEEHFTRCKASKISTSIPSMMGVCSKILGSQYALDGKPLAPILREFANRGFLHSEGDTSNTKCSNYPLLQFLVYTKRIDPRFLRMDVIQDRVECLRMLLNSGIGWSCNKKHKHETFSIGFSVAYPDGDAIVYTKSLNILFYSHFYPVFLGHIKNTTLFSLLYNNLKN